MVASHGSGVSLMFGSWVVFWCFCWLEDVVFEGFNMFQPWSQNYNIFCHVFFTVCHCFCWRNHLLTNVTASIMTMSFLSAVAANQHKADEFRSVSEPRESVNIFRYEVGSKHILRCSTSMVACTTRISYYVCLLKAPGPILITKPSQLALWASILQGTHWEHPNTQHPKNHRTSKGLVLDRLPSSPQQNWVYFLLFWKFL